MQSKSKEFLVGVFVLIGLIAVAALSLRVGNLGSNSNSEGYQILAKFENIGGLTSKAPVRMSGVTIGRVVSINIDPRRLYS